MRGAVFTLSLDLELGWGSWASGRWSNETLASGAGHARRLDDLAVELRLPFTWAVVSALNLSSDDLRDLPDEASVVAARPGLGPYDQPVPTVGRVRAFPEAFFAADLVPRLARSAAGHEIGTHTFFHATPATSAGLRADIAECQRTLPVGRRISTVVYPRDRVRHADSLSAADVDVYRPPPAVGGMRSRLPRTAERGLHAAEQVVGRRAPLVRPRRDGDVTAFPSSAVLTLRHGARRRIPWSALRRRFVRPLDDAVRKGGAYHLYSHPWNLGIPGSDADALLEEVCLHAARLRDRGDLEVLTMAQVDRRLQEVRGA